MLYFCNVWFTFLLQSKSNMAYLYTKYPVKPTIATITIGITITDAMFCVCFFDIYSLFDHNVAYEIRLQKALDEELLCPFHYYGVTDLTVNGEILNDTSDFKLLIHEERVQRITEKIEKYGSDNGINRGLIFCSRKEEAVILSDLLNKKNYTNAQYLIFPEELCLYLLHF